MRVFVRLITSLLFFRDQTHAQTRLGFTVSSLACRGPDGLATAARRRPHGLPAVRPRHPRGLPVLHMHGALNPPAGIPSCALLATNDHRPQSDPLVRVGPYPRRGPARPESRPARLTTAVPIAAGGLTTEPCRAVRLLLFVAHRFDRMTVGDAR